MRNKWKVAKKWTSTKYGYNGEKDLKIEDSNIMIGHAYQCYRDSAYTIVVARLSNIGGNHASTMERIPIPIAVVTEQELFDAWEKAFQHINDKLLR